MLHFDYSQNISNVFIVCYDELLPVIYNVTTMYDLLKAEMMVSTFFFLSNIKCY